MRRAWATLLLPPLCALWPVLAGAGQPMPSGLPALFPLSLKLSTELSTESSGKLSTESTGKLWTESPDKLSTESPGKLSTQSPARLLAGLSGGLLRELTGGLSGEISGSSANGMSDGLSAGLPGAATQPRLSAASGRTLPLLLAQALPRDPQVQGAQAVLAVAQARYRQARSRLFPNLGLQAENGRSTDLDGRFTVERQTRQVEATLRWNIYRGGADQGDIAASEFEVAAAEADLRRAKEESAERLAEAYFDLLRLARTRDHAGARLAEVVQLVAQVARQSEAGKLSDLDLQQAQNAQLEAELAQEALDSDYRSAQIKLRLLAGVELPGELTDFSFEINAGRNPVSNTAHNPVSNTAHNVAHNAALMSAQARSAAARLRVRNLAETLAPKVDLDVRHLLNNHTTPPQSTVQQHGWSVGVSWDWPLGGENLARRDETLARADQAEAEIGRAELTARAELEALNPRIANLQRSLLNLAEQEQKMALLVRGNAIQFEAGRRSLQQIIQSRDSYFSLQQRRVEQHHRLLLAQMRQLALSGQLLQSLGLAP